MLDFNRETKIDPISAFADEIERAGLGCPDIQGTGNIERFHTPDDKLGEKSGWLVLYIEPDFSAGAFGSWRNGKGKGWSSSNSPISQERIREAQSKAEIERKKNHEEAKIKAQKIWNQLPEASSNHPYLVTKGVKSYGLRQRGDKLVVPMCDINGNLYSFQEIDPQGGKKNFPGGEVKGHFYTIKGNKDPTYLCEGFATGATIHEATGNQVIISFDCGNLVYVSSLLTGNIVVAADNDWKTDGNPGLTAAKKTGLPFIFPEGIKNSDFNDLQSEKGIGAVRDLLQPSQGKFEKNLIHSDSLFSSFQSSLNISFRIKGILPQSSGLTLIYGAPGTYKSFLILDMSLSVATGIDWHGHKTKPCPVLYLAAEGQTGVLKRIEAWRQHRGVEIVGFDLLPMPCLIDNQSELNQLIQTINPGSLVILDTLARSMIGDENSTSDMGKIVIACDRIRQETGSQVILVHHVGKDESKGPRGAIALTGATDTSFKVVKTKEYRQVAIVSDRQKDYDPFQTMIFDMEVVDTGYKTIDGEEVNSLVPVFLKNETQKGEKGRINKSHKIAMDALKEALREHGVDPSEEIKSRMDSYIPGDKVVYTTFWREAAYRMGIADEPQAKKKAFKRSREFFLEDMQIKIYDDYVWIWGT